MHLGKYYWPHHGGIETALRQISEAGVSLGHSVRSWVSQEKWCSSQTERLNEVEVRRFFSLGTLFSVPLSFGLLFSRKPEMSILHVHLPNPFAEIKSLCWRNPGVQIIPYFHAFPVNQGILGRLWFRVVTKKILDRSEKILVSNPEMIELVPDLKNYSRKIAILPFSTPAIEEAERAALFDVREKKKIVLAIGRMVPYKGYPQLLRAWKKLLEERPELRSWKLILAGDGPELPELKKWSGENIPQENIEITGECGDERKQELLKNSALFVLSSVTTAETFGISLLEAFGMGLPAVVSNLPGGVKILSRNGDCGGVYSPGSEADLVNALHSLMTSPDLRNEAGKANLQFAREHFSETGLTERYRQVLDAS